MNEWYQRYLEHLRDYPLLDDTWFSQSLTLCREGDLDARNRIAGASLWVVLDVAREFEESSEMPLGDLVQEGNTAVLKAIDTFEGESCNAYQTHLEGLARKALKEGNRPPT
jgi:DNA-directed RNA polymerase sigma subunit (sigma70/sigma32)